MSHEPITLWYREPWVWFFLGLLSIGIIAGSTLATIGLRNPPELVTGDFERLGRGMTDVGERTRQARTLGLSGQLLRSDTTLTLQLQASEGMAWPDSVLLLFQHPAQSGRDMTVVAQHDGDGRYLADVTTAPYPRARIIVSDVATRWWLTGRLNPDHSQFTLTADRL